MLSRSILFGPMQKIPGRLFLIYFAPLILVTQTEEFHRPERAKINVVQSVGAIPSHSSEKSAVKVGQVENVKNDKCREK